MHVDGFVRGKGLFMITEYVPTDETHHRPLPAAADHGAHPLAVQRRRPDAPHGQRRVGFDEDVLEIHPWDAENRGIEDGDLVALASRAGETTLHARVSERMQPGVVYTTFHFPGTAANVVTTEFTDWATDCPEYKVTAVQVWKGNRSASEWQEAYEETRKLTTQMPNQQDVDSGPRWRRDREKV